MVLLNVLKSRACAGNVNSKKCAKAVKSYYATKPKRKKTKKSGDTHNLHQHKHKHKTKHGNHHNINITINGQKAGNNPTSMGLPPQPAPSGFSNRTAEFNDIRHQFNSGLDEIRKEQARLYEEMREGRPHGSRGRQAGQTFRQHGHSHESPETAPGGNSTGVKDDPPTAQAEPKPKPFRKKIIQRNQFSVNVDYEHKDDGFYHFNPATKILGRPMTCADNVKCPRHGVDAGGKRICLECGKGQGGRPKGVSNKEKPVVPVAMAMPSGLLRSHSAGATPEKMLRNGGAGEALVADELNTGASESLAQRRMRHTAELREQEGEL